MLTSSSWYGWSPSPTHSWEASRPGQTMPARLRCRGVFFLVTITTAGLTQIADLLDSGQLTTHVGEVLPLAEARLAHEMLAGKPHKRGKIVLAVDA